ncbi:hypothetical protein [Methylobacterium nonmethylotrophicum]|uniref:Uncharacterized protein n=1 Tax=Methylobacterium nonmethylotrophicum TaxID=1141884 RepID=A0A4Z0NRC0_9HYPH|nr:hypothetical protein [Methylobacterium nonmethylotrophicum]TGD98980.1 hypothetical protein EU555_13830 [Methylobacterium nonmethylotrophicum]
MSIESAFPVRETVTKIAALSYVVVRATFLLVSGSQASDTILRLIFMLIVEMPIFVILVAIVINVIVLNSLVPAIKARLVARKERRKQAGDRVGMRPTVARASLL